MQSAENTYQHKKRKSPMIPQTRFIEDVKKSHGESARKSWMNVPKYVLGEEEGMQEEEIKVQPQDLDNKKFEDLMVIMKTIVDQLKIQNE